jgi:hypothetical protein
MADKQKPQTCRWCGENRELIRAHIIPRSFYDDVRGETDKVLLLSPDKSKYTTVSQSGVFDPGILCATCDGFLGKFDDYGYKVFKRVPTDQEDLVVDRDRMPIGYNLRCDDVQRAQKFLLSVLWRASVTSHDFFAKVSLGDKYEGRIKHLIRNDEKVTEDDFEFIIMRIFDHPYDGGLMPPWGTRYDGIIFSYTLYLPFFKIIIRADKRKFLDPFSVCRFLEGAQPQALRLRYSGTSESRYISGVAASMRVRDAEREKGKSLPG